MLRARGIGRDERQVDVGLRARVDSSFLAFSAASFRRCRASLSLRRSMPLLLLELVGEVVDELHVEVFAAEERVAVRRLHLEHAVADLEDRDVERAAAEVEDRDRLGFFFLSRP